MKGIFGIGILAISIISTTLEAAPYCGELENVRDYTSAEQKIFLATVERHHFTPEIENLRHGNTGTLGADLAYTLILFPNHHRALAAFGKLSLRDKTLKPAGSKYSVGCFFDRAIRFKPNDGTVRMVYGNYLLKAGQIDEAAEQFRIAVDLEPENPTINYNLGLLYVKKKDYEQANIYAKKAYELGFPLPGLKNQLMEAGKWND
ncbi:tetratricopeptide repeat protein [Nitrosospira briensis]|uniref:TPR repeat-containing protein n=1 Tax=Nitrosospira briensis TaxID=35799 RepID=A0A1I5BPJ6_9PROT|nr:tetratricopeptide repeat protein [Nitrosospira briensis]SFN76655.1 TPR repeat-containing protein [Nitrosospira briensis]SFO30049.1 TPR repeat-containing protein [Nitrosospira briensis]